MIVAWRDNDREGDNKLYSVYWDEKSGSPVVVTDTHSFFVGQGEDFTYADIFDHFFGKRVWEFESWSSGPFEIDCKVENKGFFQIALHLK